MEGAPGGQGAEERHQEGLTEQGREEVEEASRAVRIGGGEGGAKREGGQQERRVGGHVPIEEE